MAGNLPISLISMSQRAIYFDEEREDEQNKTNNISIQNNHQVKLQHQKMKFQNNINLSTPHHFDPRFHQELWKYGKSNLPTMHFH